MFLIAVLNASIVTWLAKLGPTCLLSVAVAVVRLHKRKTLLAELGIYTILLRSPSYIDSKLVELASEMRQHSGTSVSELKRKYNHLVPSNERVMGLAETENNMSLSEVGVLVCQEERQKRHTSRHTDGIQRKQEDMMHR